MTEEQTATANHQVVSEPNAETPETGEQTVVTAPPKNAEVSTPEPTTVEPPSSSAKKSEAGQTQGQSPPEGPRFSSGVLFFLWVFCTLVFLSIAAGYIATR